MYARPFTKEIEKKARDELNETPGHREEFLRNFREWIQTEYRVQCRPEGLWLLNYVRGCKFCNQTVKKKFTNFVKLETAAPEMFSNRDPLLPEIQEILRKGAIIPFGTPDKECVIVKWDVFEFDKVDFYDVMKVAMMVMDVFMNENDTCMVIGHYVIVDFKGFSLSLLKQLTPFTLKKIFYNIFLSYPCRIKALYFVNCPGYVQTLFGLAKPFISKKLGSRTSFYGENFEEVFSVIPRRYFPTEYGGNDESIDDIIGNWKIIIEGYRDWFLEDLANTNDRSRVKDKNSYNSYDIQGSFKKLDID
ncbi:hypothetical protein PPYR_01226 [Photinus pyralis]|uniref:CRAL-TRIO domain-containing protein n=2 Tax=Photinus pyralis TaxID=7054 RepID=A0A5N4B3W5_PHOPY|nr:retinol-binding protein pinta-like isoform X2 [Photinus pyralis]XP_031345470.1 retinol-binding protein pinta-like isoform X2 [Photinus pyralis]XP_031346146.1 retinol-binding protein pinta-like isoform X2 [Photinus pyralis]XP_031346896.1 retinol-binding protein pinta-like isoform X2 [Photinus pyralis]KAB0804256.1 hypothetical protein PPYR_01226 [Photinus pyralis]